MNTKLFSQAALVLSAVILSGCAASNDPVSRGALRAEASDTNTHVLGQPAVREDDGVLHVSGSVRRSDFAPITRDGHVHVRLVDASGDEVHTAAVPYSVQPGRSTPRTPTPRLATYHAHLPGPVPDRATVRVHHCTDRHPAAAAQE